MAPPRKLKGRHKYAAFLLAMGKREGYVAKKVGMTGAYLSVVKTSPLFQLLVQQYQRDFITQGMRSTIDKVLADGPANVDFLRAVRDGTDPDIREIEDPNDRARHRPHASLGLLDRQVPKKLESEASLGVKITVEHQKKALADEACDEVGEPIDVTPVKALPAPEPRTVPRALDELIQEYEEREAVGE